MDREKLGRLRELLLEFSYEKKEVRLASGKLSSFYFDTKQTTLHPEGAYLVGYLMLDVIKKHFPEASAVGGPTLGADPIATSIAINSFLRGCPLPSFIVRKQPKSHGTMSWIEGSSHLKQGTRVVLVEDVITTGGSLIKAIQCVREAGLIPVGAVVIIDREEGGKENIEKEALPLVSLFNRSIV